MVWITLLAIFEALVGVLILLGGRWMKAAPVGANAMNACIWVFGMIMTVWALFMLAALVLLLRASRCQPAQRIPAALAT